MEREIEPVAPAFRAEWQKWIFSLAVLAVVVLPLLLDALRRPTMRERFRSMPNTAGDFSYVEHAVLDEPGDIDVLVLGTSYLWAAVDAPLLEKAFGDRLGRPAIARVVGSNFRGEEMYLLLLRETLARRHVRALILSMPTVKDVRDDPHPYAHRLQGPGFFSMYDGFSLSQRGAAAGDELIGAARHALALVRPERTETSPLVPNLGGILSRRGFEGQPYAALPPDLEPPARTAAELVYGPPSAARFAFRGPPLSDFQESFFRKLLDTARAAQTRVAIVHVPIYVERHAATVDERVAWSDVYPDVRLVGIPPADLFAGMTEAEIQRFYYSSHLNRNGATFFTRALLPALLEVLP